jgi:hypothetical protein
MLSFKNLNKLTMKYSEEDYFDPKADIANIWAGLLSQSRWETLKYVIEFREMCARVMSEKPNIDLWMISKEYFKQIQE